MKFNPVPSPLAGTQAFRTDSNCAVIVAHEPSGPGGQLRWHLSISHHNRYPHWKEITEARYFLVPDEAMMAMLLPPREQYVNVHERCFHLYEIEAGEIK